MIDDFNLVEVVIFSVIIEGESLLASVECSFEHDLQVVCEKCGREETIENNRLFRQLRSISLQENSRIKINGQELSKRVLAVLKEKLSRNICYQCHEEERDLENLKYRPTDPLWI